MIRKLDDGKTLITLGEGTVFTGNVLANEETKPFGIYFTNKDKKPEDTVIIQITSEKAVASYMMALIRFLEAHADEEMSEFYQTVQSLKKDWESLLPKAQEKS